MAIVKIVPLVQLMVQVAETHIYKWKLSEISFNNHKWLFGKET